VISVTSKSRYAVLALAELARSGDRPVPIAQVAERRGMPVQFLEQLFSTLRRDGLLQSQRGVKGGYTLARPADRITVLEVVQALDGRVGEEASEAGGIWAEGVEALRGVFRGTTIAEIARREADEAGSQMYYI
jgi:Rrf2 family cysteine metabolism transcriptional repressor